jgi:hypothetical protein
VESEPSLIYGRSLSQLFTITSNVDYTSTLDTFGRYYAVALPSLEAHERSSLIRIIRDLLAEELNILSALIADAISVAALSLPHTRKSILTPNSPDALPTMWKAYVCPAEER